MTKGKTWYVPCYSDLVTKHSWNTHHIKLIFGLFLNGGSSPGRYWKEISISLNKLCHKIEYRKVPTQLIQGSLSENSSTNITVPTFRFTSTPLDNSPNSKLASVLHTRHTVIKTFNQWQRITKCNNNNMVKYLSTLRRGKINGLGLPYDKRRMGPISHRH